MGFSFLSPWMLIGLASLSLPILIHLFSRKRYETVQWGAMQFLRPGKKRRQRIYFDHLLLLLFRMAMLLLIVLAFARPWGKGGLFSNLISQQARDLVLVLDGSYSMAAELKTQTASGRMISLAHQLLDDLKPQDRVCLIHATGRPTLLSASPITDRTHLRELLDTLPKPEGECNLPLAIQSGLDVLLTSTATDRQLIVLSDQQKRSFQLQSQAMWQKIAELKEQGAVPIQISLVDVTKQEMLTASGGEAELVELDRANLAITQLNPSRSWSLPGFRLNCQVEVESYEAKPGTKAQLQLIVDGLPLASTKREIVMEGNSTQQFDLEVTLESPGDHVIQARLETEDLLKHDNQFERILPVIDQLPILVINGSPDSDLTKNEDFFVNAALGQEGSSWVQRKSIEASNWEEELNPDYRSVFLLNPGELSSQQLQALQDYLQQGGSLLIALGDQWGNQEAFSDQYKALIPLERVNAEKLEEPIQIRRDSVADGWLSRLVSEQNSDLLKTQVTQFWNVNPIENEEQSGPVILGRYSNGTPWLIRHQVENQPVLISTLPFDADWSNLPARTDYVPFLYEALFSLARLETQQNVQLDEPAIITPPASLADIAYKLQLTKPDSDPEEIPLRRKEFVFEETGRSGVYQFTWEPSETAVSLPGNESQNLTRRLGVIVERDESDLTPMTDREIQELQEEYQFSTGALTDVMEAASVKNDAGRELWGLFLFLFVLMLAGELILTRRLVSGGVETA